MRWWYSDLIVSCQLTSTVTLYLAYFPLAWNKGRAQADSQNHGALCLSVLTWLSFSPLWLKRPEVLRLGPCSPVLCSSATWPWKTEWLNAGLWEQISTVQRGGGVRPVNLWAAGSRVLLTHPPTHSLLPEIPRQPHTQCCLHRWEQASGGAVYRLRKWFFFFPKPCLSPSAAYFITLLSFIQDIFTHPSIFSFSQLSAAHHPQRWTFIHDPLHQKCKSKQHWNYIFVNQAGRICFFFNINTHCCHVSMKLGIVMYYRQGYKLLKLSRRQWNNFYLRSWRHLCHLTWQFYLGSLCWDLGSVLEMISWVFIIICSLTSEKIELRKGG